MSDSLKYSVVVPVFQSKETLSELCQSLIETMNGIGEPYEIILIDDHSEIETWNEILRIKKANKDILIAIRLSKNFGQNGATLCGIDISRGEDVITIDDDLQVDPTEIKTLIALQKETSADVVYGNSPSEKQPFIRKLGTKTLKWIFTKREGNSKLGSSFRYIKRNVKESLMHHSHDHLFVNQVISWYTDDIVSAEIEKTPRKAGKSGYSFWKLFRIGLRLIFYYTSIPLRFAIFIGLSAAFVCFLIAGYYLYKKYAFGAELGFTAIIVSIYGATGVIISFISVLAVYINRMYNSRVRKPHYSVKVKV